MNASRTLSTILSAEVELENLPLYDMNLSENQAKEITSIVCSEFDLRIVPVLLVNQEKTKTSYSTRRGYRYKRVKVIGGCNFESGRIELYSGGQNVGVLLHEIAHQKERNHFYTFYEFNMVLVKWFKKNLKEKFFPSIQTIVEKKESEKPNMEKNLKRIVEELECEAVNNTLKMKDIGKLLLDEGLNTAENIQTVKKEMVKRGFRII